MRSNSRLVRRAASEEKYETRLVISNESDNEKDMLITYVDKLSWLMHFTCLWFSPTSPKWRIVLNLIVCALALGISLYGVIVEMYTIYQNGIVADVTTSSTLCAIIWTFQANISEIFMIYWQLTRRFFNYLTDIVIYQKGPYIRRGRKLLQRSIFRFHCINVFVVLLILLHLFAKNVLVKEHRLIYTFSPRWIRHLHTLSTWHLFLGWNFVIFVFNMFIDGTYLELRSFNHMLSKMNGSDDEAIKQDLLHALSKHTKVIRSIRELDKLFQVYAFTMIATMIPSILMTIITTANRLKQFDDVVAMGLPAFLVVLYGFLGLTISPARLYDEAHKSKTALYLNSSIWLPYRPEVYHIALALSTHLEQPNMGVTIWGFAILTKPLILATFSVMAMLLSLILELSPGDLSHHVLNLSLPS